MKELKLRTCRVAILWIALSTGSVHAQTNSGISAGSVGSYFTNEASDVPEDVRPFLRIPKDEVPLRTGTHIQVCWAFTIQARRILRPKYVPDDAFIIANLELFPATPDRKQDMAFLRCKRDGQDYLIAQTGGLQAKLVLVTQVSREENENAESEI
jgi:hypothetical protein